MKKFFSLLLAMALIVAAVFSFDCVSFASDAGDDLGTRLDNSDTYYKYDGATKTLYINGKGDVPNMYNSSNGSPWCNWDSDAIQSVVVSEGITSLGNYLFYQVRATSFSLPRTLKKIGKYSLSCTGQMKKWDIPFGVETIDNYAFYNCFYLEEVNIPSSVKKIGESAFYQCKKLKSITIPSSVTTIDKNAFFRCSELSEVNFASMTQKTTLALNAFIGCEKLKQINIPMNTSCGKNSLGYFSQSQKVDGFTMGVYKDSVAQSYAIGNGLNYTLLDSVPIKCGVEYANCFTDDNLNSTFHYTFTPETTQDYVLYSVGG